MVRASAAMLPRYPAGGEANTDGPRYRASQPGKRRGMQSENLALVTGASSGIGLELAKQFAAHGFDLIIAAEDADIETVAGGIRASGVEVEAVRVDLATPQ